MSSVTWRVQAAYNAQCPCWTKWCTQNASNDGPNNRIAICVTRDQEISAIRLSRCDNGRSVVRVSSTDRATIDRWRSVKFNPAPLRCGQSCVNQRGYCLSTAQRCQSSAQINLCHHLQSQQRDPSIAQIRRSQNPPMIPPTRGVYPPLRP